MIKKLKKQLKINTELYYGYQANIAMSFVDACDNFKRKNNKKTLSNQDIHYVANEAAKNFLNLLIKD